MRLNMPVTQQEYLYPEGASLVSTTDLDSRITYCNPAFIEVSGYESEELIGQPHNLIRHPDMPSEAFRDLWTTLRAGKPWSGLVKNRRKNGDHYWVMANVTPIRADGQVTGYLSVRTQPTRAQVDAAQSLYATMRAEAERGRLVHRLLGGRVEKAGWLPALARRLRLSLTGRMALALALVAGISALAGRLLDGLGPWAVGGAATLAVVLVAGLSWWLHRGITRPVRAALSVAYDLAAGDLTARAASSGSDEVGQMLRSLNQLTVNLQAMVADVRAQSAQVGRASQEIAASSQDLSGRTESQASSLQETAAAIEQIAATVQQNAAGATEAVRQSAGAGAVAERARDAVGAVDASMQGIARAADRIAAINGVIDSIAFQTNILALNAAVEAARAGEQGRGFAVVAGEVRTLAQRSAEAAREIKQLIEQSRSAVQDGSRLVQAASDTMRQVVADTRAVGERVEGISAASSQQAAGVVQVNAAVAQLDTATQQNAALVEESTAAAAELKTQAEWLLQSVQIFRLRQA